MQRYDFVVLKGDETIAAKKSISLPDLKAAWRHVTELARRIDEPGSRICVTNPAGEVEILAGVSIAKGVFARPHPLRSRAPLTGAGSRRSHTEVRPTKHMKPEAFGVARIRTW